jgi:hypothetical protein
VSRRPTRLLAILAALAVAALGSPGAVAAADLGDARPILGATIYKSDGTVSTPPPVTLGALANCRSYGSGPTPELYGQNGKDLGTQGLGSKGAWTLAEVLACGLNPGLATAAITGVVVHDLHGSPQANPGSRLTAADLSSPSPGDGARPLVTYDGSVVTYYRPWRGGADQNAGDKVEQPGAAPVAVDVFEGPAIDLTITASATTVPAGTAVDFGVDLHAGASGTPAYAWDFDGGATDAASASAAPHEVFPSAGTYNVSVQVHDGRGGGGVAQALITVTGPASTTPPAANAPATGPAQSSGPTPGGIAGKQVPKQSPTVKHPGAPPASQAAKPSARARKVVPARTVPRTPAQQSTLPVAAAARALSPASPTVPSQPAVKGPPRRAGGSIGRSRIVDGLLNSTLAARPIESSPLVSTVAPVRDTAPAVRRPLHASIATGLAAAFAIVLLLSLGAGHQLRWRRHPHVLFAGS